MQGRKTNSIVLPQERRTFKEGEGGSCGGAQQGIGSGKEWEVPAYLGYEHARGCGICKGVRLLAGGGGGVELWRSTARNWHWKGMKGACLPRV